MLLPPKEKDATSPFPGWIIESLRPVRLVDTPHFAVPHGQRAVELVADRESAIAQVIRTVPSRPCNLTFIVGDARNGCHEAILVHALASKATPVVPFTSSGGGGSKQAGLRFVASGHRTRVTYSSYYHTSTRDGISLCGPVLNQVKVQPMKA